MGSATVTEEPVDWGTLIVASGEVDMAYADDLRSCLRRVIQSGIPRIVFDCTQVTFMDSLALSTVLVCRRELGPQGRIALVAGEGPVLSVLQAASLDSVLDVFPTRAEAVAFVSA